MFKQFKQLPLLKPKLAGQVKQTVPLVHVEQFASQLRQSAIPPGEYWVVLQALQVPLLNPKLIGQVRHRLPLLLQVEQFWAEQAVH